MLLLQRYAVSAIEDLESSSSASEANRNWRLITGLGVPLGVMGLVIAIGAGWLLARRRKTQGKLLFSRSVTPVDDDEIESWKFPHPDDKADAQPCTHVKQVSASSSKKPPGVIVYQTPLRYSADEKTSPRFPPQRQVSSCGHRHQLSLDKEVPPTPIQARAPNARQGLTDEAIPGDEPFLPSPKHQHFKYSPLPSPAMAHSRSRSWTRTSLRSWTDTHPVSSGDLVVPCYRRSHDTPRTRHYNYSYHHYYLGHTRMYSTPSLPSPSVSSPSDVRYPCSSERWPLAVAPNAP